MKNQTSKIATIVLPIFLLTIFFADVQAQGYKFSNWKTIPCFSGIQYRTRKVSDNPYKGKIEWKIQFRNNYSKLVSFSWRMDASEQKLAEISRKLGAENRQELKAGEQDSGEMWQLVPVSDSVWIAVGHVRFLKDSDASVKTIYETCDDSSFRGQPDYFCQLKPSPGCPNFVNPKPVALVNFDKPTNDFGGKQSTVASTEDCLEAYEYFSKQRKSDNPIAVKQAIEAAQAFKARCKITDDQKAAVDQAITNSENRLERIKSSSSQTQSTGNELLSGAVAVKKVDVDAFKQQFTENFNNSLENSGRIHISNSVSIEQGKLKIKYYNRYYGEELYIVDFETLELRNNVGCTISCIAVSIEKNDRYGSWGRYINLMFKNDDYSLRDKKNTGIK